MSLQLYRLEKKKYKQKNKASTPERQPQLYSGDEPLSLILVTKIYSGNTNSALYSLQFLADVESVDHGDVNVAMST
jgi:hypothetical protein